MSTSGDAECPEPLRDALLGVLYWTLLVVRAEAGDAALCHAHADHAHNLPDLLARFRPEKLSYYWEVERPIFVEQLSAMGRRPPGAFDDLWPVVEREYRRLCEPPDA